MELREVVTQFFDHRRSRRLAKGTITQYRYQLEELWLSWRQRKRLESAIEAITIDELARYFRYLAEEHFNTHTGQLGLSAHTMDLSWRTIRAVWRFAARRKWLKPEQLDFFERDDDLIARPRIDDRMRPVLPDDTLHALLQACYRIHDPERRTRDRALVLILAESGMRIGDVASLTDENVVLDERAAAVIGKGNREEWVFWHNRADRALRAYLRARSGQPGGPMFRRMTKGAAGMSIRDIRQAIHDLADRAGVKLPKGAPVHSFRHRFAHKSIDKGLDISQLGQLMRHRSMQTTMRYLKENPKRLRRLRDRLGEDS